MRALGNVRILLATAFALGLLACSEGGGGQSYGYGTGDDGGGDANSSADYTITVERNGYNSNKYYIDGNERPTLTLMRGETYTFDLSGASSAHPFRLSATSDGTHGGGTRYTNGLDSSGTQGSSGALLSFTVPSDAPDTLYYYCSLHAGMGGTFTITGAQNSPSGNTQRGLTAPTRISVLPPH